MLFRNKQSSMSLSCSIELKLTKHKVQMVVWHPIHQHDYCMYVRPASICSPNSLVLLLMDILLSLRVMLSESFNELLLVLKKSLSFINIYSMLVLPKPVLYVLEVISTQFLKRMFLH